MPKGGVKSKPIVSQKQQTRQGLLTDLMFAQYRKGEAEHWMLERAYRNLEIIVSGLLADIENI